MAPKSATQKRRDRRKGNQPQTDGRKNAEVNHKQGKIVSALAKQNKDQSDQLFKMNEQINGLKNLFNSAVAKLPPGTYPGPLPDSKLDEKYVKVPTDAEIALLKLEEAVAPQMGIVVDSKGESVKIEMPKQKPVDRKEIMALLTKAKVAVSKVQASVPSQVALLTLHPTLHGKLLQVFSLMNRKVALPQSGDPDAMRTMLRAGLGERPIRIKLLMQLLITTTITTGVTNTVSMGGNSNGMLLSNTSEWSSISALFDEAKCMGGHTQFIYNNPIAFSATALVKENLPVIAYDPADSGGTASGTFNAMELAQHKVLPVACVWSGGAQYTASANHEFHWQVPKGVLLSSQTAGSGEWIPTAQAGSFNYGQLRFYHVGTITAAQDTGIGVITLDCEFRCRQ